MIRIKVKSSEMAFFTFASLLENLTRAVIEKEKSQSLGNLHFQRIERYSLVRNSKYANHCRA